jgi:hypothetical protein
LSGWRWHGHSSKRCNSALLFCSPTRRRPALLLTRCRSHIVHVRSDADAARLLSTLLHQPSKLTWPDNNNNNKAERTAVVNIVFSTRNSITRSEVKPHRLGWVRNLPAVARQSLVSEASNNAQAMRTGPSATLRARAMFKRGCDVIVIATNRLTCKRSSFPRFLHIPTLQCRKILRRSTSRYLKPSER